MKGRKKKKKKKKKYSQATYRCRAHKWIPGIKLLLTCRPKGRIRGSNLRVMINGLASQVWPHQHETRVSRVDRKVAGRVGSGNLTGRVGSTVFQISQVGSGRAQEAFRISRVGSGKVNTPKQIRGSPTRPDPWGLTWLAKSPEKYDTTKKREFNHCQVYVYLVYIKLV